MKKNLLDILACPIDKHYPLELIELDVKEEVYMVNNVEKDQYEHESNSNSTNKEDNGNDHNKYGNAVIKARVIADNDLHEEKVSVIIHGILYCDKCSRFYPIIDEIPIMLPDELREKEKDIRFLEKWRQTIPEKILKFANPWHL